MQFTVASAADTTLLIRAPNGEVQCDDDTNGRNPLVVFQNAPAGAYAVWVGIYQAGSRNLYQLTATTQPR